MTTPTGHKTFKYKLRPTPEQSTQLVTTLRLCRELYNAALQERKEAWQKCRVSVNYYQQKAQLPEIRAYREDCAAVNAQVLQDVILRMERAFKAFFRRVANGDKPGYPRFKGRNRYHSFTFPQVGPHGCAQVDNEFLVLSKIGRIAVRWSRPLEGTPKTVSIIQEPDGWYACIACAAVPIQPLPLKGEETDIDLGLESFLTLANGEPLANPRHYRKAEKRLVKAQRRVSKRKRGSKRRSKAVRLLQRAHQKIARQRRDFHHKTVLLLIQQYDTIFHEDLQVANLVQNGQLAKSIHDAGWRQFCTILTFKAANAGKRAIAVPPAYTSQVCSGCGVLVQKGLSVRWHECPDCGASLHRDHNAAQNIQRAGQTHRGVATRKRHDEPRIPSL
ncbi:MAG TPA: transposase [Ktedonobacterales bacterium]|nr:transposase [Ktedonobacterales bacterium]